MKTIKSGVLAWLGFFMLLVMSGCANTGATGEAQIDQLRANAEQGDASAQFELAIAYDQARNQAEAAI